MEKLIYVVWKRAEASPGGFKEEMLGEVAGSLQSLRVQGLSMNLADELASFAQGMRITRMAEPPSGTVSIWLETALDLDPVHRVLEKACPRWSGYRVRESVPIVNTSRVVPLGERIPGITTVALLERPEAMSHEAWVEQWQGHHTRVAIETQSTFFYIQNLITEALSRDAPPWSAIVEEGFPAEAATDPMVFFAAGGSPERLAENRRRMVESCSKFLDLARVESHPMSSYVLKA